MADFASSIITITQTSLTIIKEIKKFIEQVRLVDTLVNKLLAEFKDLYSLIKVVHSTYKRALTGEHVGTSNFVGQCLLKCRDKLGQMKELVVELASQDTDTFFRRLSVQRRYEAIRKDIATGTEEIHKYIQHIRTGIECWNLDVATANRRLSEAMAAHHGIIAHTDASQSHIHNIRPLDRSFSNTDTLLEHSETASSRRMSIATVATAHSRHSVSSNSSRAVQSPSDNESILSNQDQNSPCLKNEIKDFHYQITKYGLDEIANTLTRHQEPALLVRSSDGLQRTPLHLAAQRGDTKLAEILLGFGADIDAKDTEPASVLDFAVAFNNNDFVAFLLDHGVDESALLNRNKPKFKEIKRIVNFRKSLAESPKQHRKMSWGRNRAQSNGIINST